MVGAASHRKGPETPPERPLGLLSCRCTQEAMNVEIAKRSPVPA